MFEKAKPIWLEGKQGDINIQALFNACFKSDGEHILLRITGASLYRIIINGVFVHYGPARAAHKYARVDEIDITEYCSSGENKVTIEVAGYNCNSFYTIKQLSYVCAEIYNNTGIIAYTGRDFNGKILNERLQKVMRYSFQRTFSEVWCLDNDNPYGTKHDVQTLELDLKYLERGVEIPDYSKNEAKTICIEGNTSEKTVEIKKDRYIVNPFSSFIHFKEDIILHKPYYDFQKARQNIISDIPKEFQKSVIKAGEYIILDMSKNRTGFIFSNITAKADSRVIIAFDEALKNGILDFERWNMINIVEYNLNESNKTYELESFEAYEFRFAMVWVVKGNIELNSFAVRSYCYPVYNVPTLHTEDQVLKNIYTAAIETFRQNTLDVFMDCPSRERAGWLFDSYYTAQAEYCFTGKSKVEKAFLSNFVMYDNNTNVPNGMLPMCYPADILDELFIPQWSMWFVLELEQFLNRCKDSDRNYYKDVCYGLVTYFEAYKNGDGMLEKLPSWSYVDWSDANKWTQDVNYPTNMLYSKMLKIIGTLYDDRVLLKRAVELRDITLEKSFNGQLFTDNAVRDKDNKLINTGNMSEACQYYAIRFAEIDINEQRYAYLKEALLNIFGPQREHTGLLPEVAETDTLMGKYLRMEILLGMQQYQKLLEEIKAYFGDMVQYSGTLWEHNDIGEGSLNHGFASYVGVAIKQALENINE